MANAFKAVMLAFIMLASLSQVQAEVDASNAAQTPVCNADRQANWTVGLIQCTNNVSDGYTLFSPMPSTTSFLIDNEGRQVHN